MNSKSTDTSLSATATADQIAQRLVPGEVGRIFGVSDMVLMPRVLMAVATFQLREMRTLLTTASGMLKLLDRHGQHPAVTQFLTAVTQVSGPPQTATQIPNAVQATVEKLTAVFEQDAAFLPTDVAENIRALLTLLTEYGGGCAVRPDTSHFIYLFEHVRLKRFPNGSWTAAVNDPSASAQWDSGTEWLIYLNNPTRFRYTGTSRDDAIRKLRDALAEHDVPFDFHAWEPEQ